MAHQYSQRSLLVLSLQGVLSAIMAALSVILIFQLQSLRAAGGDSALIPASVWAVLQPVSTVLSALSLTLHLSSVLVCLLHSYFSTEVCREEQDTHRYLSRSQTPELEEGGPLRGEQLFTITTQMVVVARSLRAPFR